VQRLKDVGALGVLGNNDASVLSFLEGEDSPNPAVLATAATLCVPTTVSSLFLPLSPSLFLPLSPSPSLPLSPSLSPSPSPTPSLSLPLSLSLSLSLSLPLSISLSRLSLCTCLLKHTVCAKRTNLVEEDPHTAAA
jgi:hypothetical protein